MSIVCRPQIVIPMMPGPPAQCRPAAPAGHDSASAQVSSRTRGWEVRVRLETCALAEVGARVTEVPLVPGYDADLFLSAPPPPGRRASRTQNRGSRPCY